MPTIEETTRLFYLAFTVWREARGESPQVQAAVAYSILNREANGRWWGHTVDEIVTKPWQYSSLTDPKDPQLAKSWPKLSDPSWGRVFDMVQGVLAGTVTNLTEGADSYYDVSIPAPSWTLKAGVKMVGQIGRIRFFDTKEA